MFTFCELGKILSRVLIESRGGKSTKSIFSAGMLARVSSLPIMGCLTATLQGHSPKGVEQREWGSPALFGIGRFERSF